jgi:lysophospholipase L1-like esterase
LFNDWSNTTSSGIWKISSNQATVTTTESGWVGAIVRPTLIQNGKAEVTVPISTSWTGTGVNYSIAARTIEIGGKYYMYCGFYNTGASGGGATAIKAMDGQTSTAHCGGTGVPAYDTKTGANALFGNTGSEFKMEMIVESTSSTSTTITLNSYVDGELKQTNTAVDTTSELQAAGKWGLTAGRSTTQAPHFSSFTLYQEATALTLSMTGNAKTVKTGNAVQYTFSDDEDQTITLTDNGAGGLFSPSNIVSLSSSNSYQTTITYTPVKVGDIVISGTVQDSSDELEDEIFAVPYNTTVGFIGDSITYGSHASNPATTSGVANEIHALGSGWSALNRGVSGGSTQNWVDNLDNRLTDALSVFQSNNVDIVQITLGNGDGKYGTTPANYKANYENIISQLKAIGVGKIILNQQPSSSGEAQPDLISQYREVIHELVDGETVFLGDTDAFDYFAANPSELDDGVHPTDVGYVSIGNLWAAAFNRVIIEPLTLTHDFTGTTIDSHTKETATGLEYTVDKDIAWFDVQSGYFANVLVDNIIVDPSDYTASSGSTVITLAPSYLDTLAVGPHSLTVRFTDGVNFTSAFNILAANTSNGNSSSSGNGLASPNTGTNLGKFINENKSAVLAALAAVIAGLGISIVLVGRKLTKNA